ncbi:MAG: 2TM domain-containing protein [Bacteroidota bacterium]
MDLSEFNRQEEDRRYQAYDPDKRKFNTRKRPGIHRYTPTAFHRNLKTFVGVCAVIMLINMAVTPYHLWSLYIVFFWGINVINHYYTVYGKSMPHRASDQIMDLDNSLEAFDLDEIEYESNDHSKENYLGY